MSPQGVLMGRKGVGRVTSVDIAKAGGVASLIESAVKSAGDGDGDEMASMQYSPANPNDSLNVKMKFHFFSFQISEKTGFKGFA